MSFTKIYNKVVIVFCIVFSLFSLSQGKTKIEMPICVKEEKMRIKNGGPLLNYVEKKQV